jgi:hypothetical protein
VGGRGLARVEVRRDGDEWVADAPFGKVRVRFVEPNAFGVMDHDVKLESGVTVRNPMRVVANGAGSELVFTLIRQPGMSDEQLARDREAVESDLRTLKGVLEHTERLFAYGTLQLEAVQTATFGRRLSGTAGRVDRVRSGATGDPGRGGDCRQRQGATHHGQVHRTPVRRHTGNGVRGLSGGDPERGPVRGGRGQTGGRGSPVRGARVGVRRCALLTGGLRGGGTTRLVFEIAKRENPGARWDQ